MAVFTFLPAPQGGNVLFCTNRAVSGVHISGINCALCNLDFYTPYKQAQNDFAILLRSCVLHDLLELNVLDADKLASEQGSALRRVFGPSVYRGRLTIIPESFLALYQRFLAAHAHKLSPQIQRWMDNVLTPMFRHSGSDQEAEEYSKAQGYMYRVCDVTLIWRHPNAHFDGLSKRFYGSLGDDLKLYFMATSEGSSNADELDEFVDVGTLNRWFRNKPCTNTGAVDPELEHQLELEVKRGKASYPSKKTKTQERTEREEYLKELHTKVRASIDAIKGSTPCYCAGKFFAAPATPLWDSAPSYRRRFKAAHKKAS